MTAILLSGIPSAQAAKTPKKSADAAAPSADTLHPASVDEMNQMLSRLTDEQVRQILIQQLEKTIPPDKGGKGKASGKDAGLMHGLDDFSTLCQQRFSEIGRNIPLFFSDIHEAVQKLTDEKGAGVLPEMLMMMLVIIGLAGAVERIWWRSTANVRSRFESAPVMQGWMKFWTGILRLMPDFIGIFIFILAGGTFFALIRSSEATGWRLLFIALMLAVVVTRLIYLILKLIFAPKVEHLRLVPVGDETALYLQRRLFLLFDYYGLFYILMLMNIKLEMPLDSNFLIVLIISIPFMVFLTRLVWENRLAVADHLKRTGRMAAGETSWLREQLAGIWHFLGLAYIILLWILGMVRFALYGPQYDMAYVVSFLIIPLYLVLNQAGKWVVRETLGTIRKTDIDENTTYYKVAVGIVRVSIGFSLLLWLLHVWGIRVPFIERTVHAVFSILFTLVLAHVIWGMTNRYIQRKLEKLAPTPAEENEEVDDEFSGVTLDRSFTLLPMLRKFLGTVMLVMVTLIVLSSLGINIAPLMAGAGVVGLAIGFGSQKLVADVLSGAFYLIDDTFRVGEYIQAGSVSGTVEGFSLRNIMLRHDKGALQIVPFSKLGAVTNLNRGGMVMKFMLNLPYDTNIEQVRKIIKKVNQKIMDDPELGPDLLRPIKYAGVKSAADSVMTFRVRFTAKFGSQGLIQRKAFEMITKALADKGIHFAHRKVIVEMPPGLEKTPDAGPETAAADPGQMEQLKAGAAAALAQMMAEDAAKKSDSSKNK